jgi:hypothetical protein
MFPRFLLLIAIFSLVARVSADTFVVTNTNDNGPGSLRQAMTDANAHPNSSDPDTITFNIPGNGVHTITVSTALPDITAPLVINGWSQPGFQSKPLIELTAAAGTTADGLRVLSSSVTVRGMIINGFGTGILIDAPNDHVIQGCYIGTDKTGTLSAPNNRGILIMGSDHDLIGGSWSAARNLISGNLTNGIALAAHQMQSGPFPTLDTIVQGNLIGTDITGLNAIPNGADGISVQSSGRINIGGALSSAKNVISGNLGNGVNVVNGVGFTIGTTLSGNFIGVAADGAKPLGNQQNGILISGLQAIVQVRNGNRIAFSGGNGISVTQTNPDFAQLISGNSIYNNALLGIDLGGDGPTPNDPGDGDSGPNNLQNFPVISDAFAFNGQLTLYGSLNSTASKNFTLEFFANAAPDNSGYGEGQVFLGSALVTTDGFGNVPFNVTFPLPANVTAVAAVAFQLPNAISPLGTSEFSPAVNIVTSQPRTPPTPPTSVSLPQSPSQLLNLSARLRVETGDNVLIGGFIVVGTDSKKVIVRGIGPSLAAFNVPGYLADPILELYDGSGQLLAANDNWKQDQQSEIQNSGLAPSNELESAIIRTVAPGNYTAILRGKNNSAGVGLVEVYDLNSAASYQGNISTRGFVGNGDNVMIGGFIAGGSGTGPTTIAIRGLGPSLAAFGISNPLADPTLELRNANGILLNSNNEWVDSEHYYEIRATGLQPGNAHEAMILYDVTPGNYTAILRGTSNGTGVGLLEIYNLR